MAQIHATLVILRSLLELMVSRRLIILSLDLVIIHRWRCRISIDFDFLYHSKFRLVLLDFFEVISLIQLFSFLWFLPIYGFIFCWHNIINIGCFWATGIWLYHRICQILCGFKVLYLLCLLFLFLKFFFFVFRLNEGICFVLWLWILVVVWVLFNINWHIY